MKPLPQIYTRSGYHFRLVQRIGDITIYSQHDNETGDIHCYEVFVVRRHNGYRTRAGYVEAGEYKPSTAMWGKIAFSPTTLTKARERALQLIKKLDFKS